MMQTLLTRATLAGCALVLGALSLLALAGCQQAARPESVETFLERHWQNPVPAQGQPPAHFSPAEASLDPEACATCHASQYQEWRSALHGHTMGAGIRWQFELLGQEIGRAHV